MNRPNLNDIANKFAESQLQLGSECPLKPFDPDENDTKSWIDPLTKWSLNRIPIGAQIEWVFLLNDWLPENQINKPVGTLDSNVEYCERWYSKPWNEQGKPDATFANLFWCWSRSLLETKRCVVMNTLWGARVWDETTGKKTKEAKTIPDESYEKAKEIICHPLIDWAKPHTI